MQTTVRNSYYIVLSLQYYYTLENFEIISDEEKGGTITLADFESGAKEGIYDVATRRCSLVFMHIAFMVV